MTRLRRPPKLSLQADGCGCSRTNILSSRRWSIRPILFEVVSRHARRTRVELNRRDRQAKHAPGSPLSFPTVNNNAMCATREHLLRIISASLCFFSILALANEPRSQRGNLQSHSPICLNSVLSCYDSARIASVDWTANARFPTLILNGCRESPETHTPFTLNCRFVD